MTRILFVGEDNPYGADPRYALFCEPPNSAGGRLCRKICGLKRHTYLALPRVNLCAGKWSMREARVAAGVAFEGALASGSHTVLALLGRKVGDAFRTSIRGIPWDFEPFTHHAHIRDRLTFVSLPHPSGRCTAWNELGAYEKARDLLRQVCPDVPWGEAL